MDKKKAMDQIEKILRGDGTCLHDPNTKFDDCLDCFTSLFESLEDCQKCTITNIAECQECLKETEYFYKEDR